MTKDKERGIRNYFWAHDHQHVIYLKDDGGDENDRIHVVNIQTLENKVCTPATAKALIYAVSKKHPHEIVIGLNDRDPKYHDVYRLNLLTGDKVLIFQNDQHFSSFIFDDTFALRFAASTKEDGGKKYFQAVASPAGYHWTSFLEVGLEDVYTTGLLGLTEDGNTLYVKDSRGEDKSVLKEIHLQDYSEKILGCGTKADIGGIIRHPSTKIIQAYTVHYLRKEWTCLDEGFASHFNKIKNSLDDEIVIVSRTDNDARWIVAHIKDNGPAGYYLYTKADQKLKFLFHNRDDLKGYALAKMEGVVITARDGLEMPCYITKPSAIHKKVPMVVLVHGGPWARDFCGYSPLVQLLANRGFAVLQVNYRGSTGFGKSFISKGNLEWGRKMHEDILDSVHWAIEAGVADPQAIAIFGGSYGGYESLWAATQSSDVFACAVDLVGPSNLETLLQTFPPYWASFMNIAYQQIGDPRTSQGRALLKERSPLTHVDKIKIPVLVAQGENDPRVKQAESEQIVAAMKEKKLSYIYMLFRDEGHGLVRPENKMAFYAVAERFLADRLGGKYEPLGRALEKSTLDEREKKDLAERFGS